MLQLPLHESCLSRVPFFDFACMQEHIHAYFAWQLDRLRRTKGNPCHPDPGLCNPATRAPLQKKPCWCLPYLSWHVNRQRRSAVVYVLHLQWKGKDTGSSRVEASLFWCPSWVPCHAFPSLSHLVTLCFSGTLCTRHQRTLSCAHWRIALYFIRGRKKCKRPGNVNVNRKLWERVHRQIQVPEVKQYPGCVCGTCARSTCCFLPSSPSLRSVPLFYSSNFSSPLHFIRASPQCGWSV